MWEPYLFCLSKGGGKGAKNEAVKIDIVRRSMYTASFQSYAYAN